MYKRIISVFIAIFFITTTLFGFEQWTSAESDKVLTVGTDTNYVPFEFLDPETREYVGFDMDLIDAIAKEIGFEYELKPMDYAGITPALQTGNLTSVALGVSKLEQMEDNIKSIENMVISEEELKKIDSILVK